MGSEALGAGWGSALLQTAGSLLLICAAAFLLIRFLGRRLRRSASAGGPLLQRVSSLPLGPGNSLHLVKAADRLLLVGSATGGVTLLAELAREAPLAPVPDPSLAETPPGDGHGG